MKKIVVLAVLVCTTLAFGNFTGTSKSYKICNMNSGMYLQPYGGVNTAKTNIVQNLADGQSYQNGRLYQEWKFVQIGSTAYYFIQNSYGSNVMDLSGSNIIQNTKNTNNNTNHNQQWQIIALAKNPSSANQNTIYTIKNYNGKVLDIQNGSTSDGVQAIQNSSNGAAASQQWLIEDATPWTQTQTGFLIGAWEAVNADANLNPNYFNNLKNCKFNTIVFSGLWQPDFSCLFMTRLTSTYSSPNLYSNSLPPFCNSGDYSKLVPASTSSLPSFESYLSLAKTASIRVLVNPDNGVGTIAGDYLDPIGISDAQCKLDANYNASFFKNFSKYRDQMLGYFIADEPGNASTSSGKAYQINRANLIQDQLVAADPGKLGLVDLTNSGCFLPSWDNYAQYVDNYIARQTTRAVMSFYYIFETSMNPSGYLGIPNGSYPLYFKYLNLFASTIQTYKNRGKQTTFLGNMGMSREEISNGYNHPIPTEAMLRYFASSSLIYGAKGMIWYTYAHEEPISPYAIDNNTDISTAITNINGELAKMGPILMGLDWVETIHGSSTDPCSHEPNLPIQTNQDAYFSNISECVPYSSDPTWNVGYSAIGVLKPSSGPDLTKGIYYLLVMNKDLQYQPFVNSPGGAYTGRGYNIDYTVMGSKTDSLFDKTNSTPTKAKWICLDGTAGAYFGTGFQVTVGQGDFQLIKVAPK